MNTKNLLLTIIILFVATLLLGKKSVGTYGGIHVIDDTILVSPSSPSEARIYVDGVYVGKAPMKIQVSAGSHTVRLTYPPYFEDCFLTMIIPKKNNAELTYLRKNGKGYNEYLNKKDGSILVKIPSGEFIMGRNNWERASHPAHKVYLDEYYIGKYEITNAQYKKFCDETGWIYPIEPFSQYRYPANSDTGYFFEKSNYPVVGINWYDAVAYCRWAGLRLPSETEWEKAARGTDGRIYPWGNKYKHQDLKDRANGALEFYDNGFKPVDGYLFTSPVGSFPKGQSPFGCFDIVGNVFEWCRDWCDEDYYNISPEVNPQGPLSGKFRVIRGFSCRSGSPQYMYTFERGSTYPDYERKDIGFRAAYPSK